MTEIESETDSVFSDVSESESLSGKNCENNFVSADQQIEHGAVKHLEHNDDHLESDNVMEGVGYDRKIQQQERAPRREEDEEKDTFLGAKFRT